jgi:hypothetical protein
VYRSGRGDIPLGSALAGTTVETRNTDPATGIAELWIGNFVTLVHQNFYSYERVIHDLCLLALMHAIFWTSTLNVDLNVVVIKVRPIFSGGKERVCWINDEDTASAENMRFSGDLVVRNSDGSICYRGRKDDMVKRHGKRFHLQEVEKVSFCIFLFLFACRK